MTVSLDFQKPFSLFSVVRFFVMIPMSLALIVVCLAFSKPLSILLWCSGAWLHPISDINEMLKSAIQLDKLWKIRYFNWHLIIFPIRWFGWQEYVIVLLRNGRRKDEARNELNVFLGDDSVSFVSWYFNSFSNFLLWGKSVLIWTLLSGS